MKTGKQAFNFKPDFLLKLAIDYAKGGTEYSLVDLMDILADEYEFWYNEYYIPYIQLKKAKDDAVILFQVNKRVNDLSNEYNDRLRRFKLKFISYKEKMKKLYDEAYDRAEELYDPFDEEDSFQRVVYIEQEIVNEQVLIHTSKSSQKVCETTYEMVVDLYKSILPLVGKSYSTKERELFKDNIRKEFMEIINVFSQTYEDAARELYNEIQDEYPLVGLRF